MDTTSELRVRMLDRSVQLGRNQEVKSLDFAQIQLLLGASPQLFSSVAARRRSVVKTICFSFRI